MLIKANLQSFPTYTPERKYMTSDCPHPSGSSARGYSPSLTASQMLEFSPQEITQSLWTDQEQKTLSCWQSSTKPRQATFDGCLIVSYSLCNFYSFHKQLLPKKFPAGNNKVFMTLIICTEEQNRLLQTLSCTWLWLQWNSPSASSVCTQFTFSANKLLLAATFMTCCILTFVQLITVDHLKGSQNTQRSKWHLTNFQATYNSVFRAISKWK